MRQGANAILREESCWASENPLVEGKKGNKRTFLAKLAHDAELARLAAFAPSRRASGVLE